MRKVYAGLCLLFVLNVSAQDCSVSLLFKKGAELEYKTYMPTQVGFFNSLDYIESTRLLYKIDDVRDSIGNKYSYITKKGTNPQDESMYYLKRYVLVCDGKNIAFPFDFYSVDTIFFTNKYPKMYKDKGIYSASLVDTGITYSFPLDLEKGKISYYSGKIKTSLVIRDYRIERDGLSSAIPREGKMHSESTITGATIGAKNKMPSPVGMLDAYKLVLDINLYYSKTNFPAHYLYDYNTQFGLIKTELITELMKKKAKAGYMELFHVKK